MVQTQTYIQAKGILAFWKGMNLIEIS